MNEARGTQNLELTGEELPDDPRRRSRWLAVQSLYEWDSTGHDPLEALTHQLEDHPDTKAVESFARTLVSGVREHQQAIDAVLVQAAPQWQLEQMAVVDRNIIRVAIYEVLVDNKTPVRAALNEAVELAKTFGAESSPRFVNGVLGAVAALATR
ncbi:MAG: transcription antitermination factor NusB [Dehalococcoidia bacterium]